MLEEERASPSDNTNNTTSATTNGQTHPKNNAVVDTSVNVVNASAKWSADIENDTLSNITFKVPGGKLCAVIGPVGSGKVRIKLEYYCTRGGTDRGVGDGRKKKNCAIPARANRLKIFTLNRKNCQLQSDLGLV
jgi:ATPase subunit of ABC transporter with duplicated ATPase domains